MDDKNHYARMLSRFNDRWRLDRKTGCWLWFSCLDKDGYGRIQCRDKTLKAHRVSYQIHHGPIPRGRMVLHTCDTPACVNPAHLYAGTAADNVRDCLARGRYRPGGKPHPGEKNGRAKLTSAQVLEIRRRGKTEINRVIAVDYGLNPSAIQRITSGKAWRHLQ